MMLRLRRLFVVLLVSLPVAGCGTAVFTVDRTQGLATLERQGIGPGDYQDIAAGRLTSVRDRLMAKPLHTLSLQQLSMLCDLHVKAQALSEAAACNDAYRQRAQASGDAAALSVARRRQALLHLGQGEYEAVGRDLEGDESDNAVYLARLARTRIDARQTSGDPAAWDFPERLARYQKPQQVYFAASLYAEGGNCRRALELLEDPFRRLLADYGLRVASPENRASFRLDLVQAFDIGVVSDQSVAPSGNVYVEFLAAKCLHALGRPADARRHLDRLRAFPHIRAYADLHWQILHLAGLIERQSDPRSAIERFKEAIAVIEAGRSSITTDAGLVAFAASTQDVYADLIETLLRQDDLTGALEYVERAKCRLLVERLASLPVLAPYDVPQSQGAALLAARRAAEQAMRLQTTGQGALAAEQALREADDRIARRSPTLAWLTGARPRRFAELLPSLRNDQAAIVYFALHGRWHVMLVERNGIAAHRELGPSPVLPAELLEHLMQPTGDAYRPYARKLYDHFLKPVLALTQAKDLLIVPHGELFAIPLGVLHDGAQPVAATRRIRVAPSLSALAALRTEAASASRAGLILGNPARRDTSEYKPLQYAEREAEAIKSLFPDSPKYLTETATIDRLIREARGKAFLHIAAHGRVSADQPSNSKLLLADVSGNGDLTVEMIHGLALPANLAVLSACESASRGGTHDQDLISLAESFLASGVRSVVASHWQVNDAATAEFMRAFYEELRRGQPVTAALQSAQLKMMQDKPHPFYWAAFSAIGADVRL